MYRSTDINNFRPPSADERKLISDLTAAEFPGRAEVIEQLEQCVVRLIDEDGSLELRVMHPVAAPVLHRIPTELYGPDVDGVQISVLLHVVDGLCREIEIYKVDGTTIQRMPEIWHRFIPGPDEAE
ncbi:hypothetical protein MKD38_21620 [Cupriavidus sp. WGlv3]|uniref:DUF6984 family protein n=1 Tax=Cupriavidus sp. WGlv3 TaxID=2919924 RepID=UPI00209062C2|nr:hypothetical protein [Cupriavidus sp. WGlv3]MCO4864286.1 hypothetical protein [Cupriavidus sp. WGlv3]